MDYTQVSMDMQEEIIISVIGIIILIIVIFTTLKKPSMGKVRSKENKKIDIINRYKKRLDDELQMLNGDKKAIKSRKSVLLKEFNMELSQNIFFDKNEIRTIILDLSRY